MGYTALHEATDGGVLDLVKLLAHANESLVDAQTEVISIFFAMGLIFPQKTVWLFLFSPITARRYRSPFGGEKPLC